MKLRRKISLIALSLTASAILICTVLMAVRAACSMIDLTVSNAETNQAVRSAAWMSAMNQAASEKDSPLALRSLARACAVRYGDSGTVLVSGNDHILNGTDLEPQSFLDLTAPEENGRTGKQSSVIGKRGRRRLLLAGSAGRVEDTVFGFYQVTDITHVYDGIREMVLQFAAVDAVVIALAAGLCTRLLKQVMQPLEELKAGTEKIADGFYGERVKVSSEDEIGALAEDFNRMAAAVDQHVQALRREAQQQTMLLAALTHELKTPLTGIRGNAETLLMTWLDEEEQQEALQFIESECTRMERLSQKLMTLLSLRQEKALELTDCRVSDLFARAEASCAEQLRERGLTLITENHMDTVRGEPDLLVSLLLNLIDNAGKASQPGGKILLGAEDNSFFVRDFGCGMQQEDLDKITQPFYMADKSRSRKAGGTGLGLALCAEIAALHKAELSFDSRPGEGTTVKLQFACNPMNTC